MKKVEVAAWVLLLAAAIMVAVAVKVAYGF